MRILVSFFLFVLGANAFAQNKKASDQGTFAEAFYPQQEQSSKKSRKSKPVKIPHDAREKLYARQQVKKKSREKNYARIDRSQVPYFGHKHRPRIRPVGKHKLCKVCGLTH